MDLKQESSPRWLSEISRFLNIISSGILFLLMMLTVADVFLKKILSENIPGIPDISAFMTAILVFFSLSACEFDKGNVIVHSLINKLSAASRAMIEALIKLLGFLFSCFVAVAVFNYAGRSKASGEVSSNLSLPLYPVIYIAALAITIFAFILLFRLIIAVKEVRTSWIQ